MSLSKFDGVKHSRFNLLFAAPKLRRQGVNSPLELQATIHRGSGGNGSLWLLEHNPCMDDVGKDRIQRGSLVQVSMGDVGFAGHVMKIHSLEKDWVIFAVQSTNSHEVILMGTPYPWAHIQFIHKLRKKAVPWSLTETLPSQEVLLARWHIWDQTRIVTVIFGDD